MDIRVNGLLCPISVIYGDRVSISYEQVIKLAGKSPLKNYTVTYLSSEKEGILSKGERVAFSVSDSPKFQVSNTSNA